MKIHDISKQMSLTAPSSDPSSRSRTEGNARPEESGSGDAQQSGARIDISKASMEHQKIAEAAQAGQPERLERVNQLREAMETGHYDIDSSRVAEKMISEGLMDTLKS